MARTMRTARLSTEIKAPRIYRTWKPEDPHKALTLFQIKLLESQSFPFMQLPLELREMLYTYAFCDTTLQPMADPYPRTTDIGYLSGSPSPSSLSQPEVSKQIEIEALGVLNRKCFLRLDATRSYKPQSISKLGFRNGIQKVIIPCSAQGTVTGENAIKIFAEAFPQLREVELQVLDASRKTTRAEKNINAIAKRCSSAKVTVSWGERLVGTTQSRSEKAPDVSDLSNIQGMTRQMEQEREQKRIRRADKPPRERQKRWGWLRLRMA